MPDALEQLTVLMRIKLPTASYEQCQQLARYLHYVAEYSPVLNLTGLKSRNELVDGLVVEALKVLELADIAATWQAIDLGSGNGSPVIPLALLCSEAQFHAVEIRERRVAFLNTARAGLHLENLHVHQLRVEDVVQSHAGTFDLVTSRAFAPPDTLLPLALRLVREGGEIRGFTGPDTAQLTESAQANGLTLERVLPYSMHGETRHAYMLRYGPAPTTPPRQALYGPSCK